jgi:N-acetylglucosamine-6-phosphate deacetylase
MRLTGGRVFDLREGFVLRDVCFDGPLLGTDGGAERTDVSGCWVIPGLTDLHFHGCRGADVSDGEAEGLRTIARYELRRGVTQICPAGMTLPPDALRRLCRAAAAYRAAPAADGAELAGLHLEGPFLSAAKKGAQAAAFLRGPDAALLRELHALSGGLVKLVTVAPELPGALDFIAAAPEDVTVSLGHTSADYETALAAFRAGAAQATHLFNAMPPLNHRAPGVVGAAADCPWVRAELICDGVHIHPSVVRAVFRLFGPERVILISDSMRAAGMPDGAYTLGGQAVTVSGSQALLADGTLAGSVTDLMECLRRAVSFGIPLEQAVAAAAVNPARVLGIDGRVGTLEPCKEANLAVLDGDLRLRAVYFHGALVAPEGESV